jgi:hypothetical protein
MKGLLGFSGQREGPEALFHTGQTQNIYAGRPSTRPRRYWRVDPERMVGFELGRSLDAAQSRYRCEVRNPHFSDAIPSDRARERSVTQAAPIRRIYLTAGRLRGTSHGASGQSSASQVCNHPLK